MSLGELLLPSVFRPTLPRLRLGRSDSLTFEKVPVPERRLLRIEARDDFAAPTIGETLSPGDQLGYLGLAPVVSPCAVRVVDVRPIPYSSGGAPALCVECELDPDAPKLPDLPKLSDSAKREELLERFDELGICAFGRDPLPLSYLLGDDANGRAPRTVVVNAADKEPLLASELGLLRAQGEKDVEAALATVSRAADGCDVYLAVLTSQESLARQITTNVLPVAEQYPAALPELVGRSALAAGARGPYIVISLETALAAHQAVTKGLPVAERYLTVVAADESCRNVCVAVGTPASAVFDHLGVAVEDQDRVIFGGPMRGRSEYVLDASVDIASSALMIIATELEQRVENDPCISCGNCIDACPMKLQPNELGRNAEFGFYERNPALDIESCILCGLCAHVCPSGRPITQWIELSLAELARDSGDDDEAATGADAGDQDDKEGA